MGRQPCNLHSRPGLTCSFCILIPGLVAVLCKCRVAIRAPCTASQFQKNKRNYLARWNYAIEEKCQQEKHAWVNVLKCLRVNEWTSTPLSELTWGQCEVLTSRAAITWHHSLSFPAINFFKTLLTVFLHLVLCHCVFWLPRAWFLCSHDSTPCVVCLMCLCADIFFGGRGDLFFFWLSLYFSIS